MKLITFQSMEALEFLINNKYLICDEKNINQAKMGDTYGWVTQKMRVGIDNKYNAKYPLWAWVKCYNNICPPKRKGEKIPGYDVKITFNKDVDDIFITDFRRYSFILNNMYIPNSNEDKLEFDDILKKHNISKDELKAYVRRDKYESHRTDKNFLEACEKIRKSWDRCITNESDVLQACIWYIEMKDIISIEILNDENYSYGSINYIRKNGERFNWIEDYYKKLN